MADINTIERSVFLGRVAEQAELYDEMVEYLKPLMTRKGQPMTHDERTLVAVALKNLLKEPQKAWRTLIALEPMEKMQDYKNDIDEYK